LNDLRLPGLVALFASACAAGSEPNEADELPGLAMRALGIAPGSNYVATFATRQLAPQPEARALTTDAIGWSAWRNPAALLELDPFEDASMVAVTAFVGPCGLADGLAVAAPTAAPELFAARVNTAIERWRTEHPPPVPDESGEPPDPALSRWVPVADGTCTVLQASAFERVGITLAHDGHLLLHTTFSGHACRALPEAELPPEAEEATRLAGRALVNSWQARPAAASPALLEAMPGGALVTRLGGTVTTEQIDYDP
jgi:hypothetical protein